MATSSQQAKSLGLFKQRLPARPYCSDNLAREGVYRMPLEIALGHLLIQPNTAKRHVCLCFDVDRPSAAMDWEARNMPPPNLTVMNPANGHAHLIYLLTAPVPVSAVARIKPIQFMAAVQEGLRRGLEADRGYTGLIVKNPVHPHWKTAEWEQQPYELCALAEWVTLPTPAEMRKRVKTPDYAGLGRNCTVFEIVRVQSYRIVRDYWRPGGQQAFERAVLNAVLWSNHRDIGNPLDQKECRTIAKSISRWTWQHFTPRQFREVQARRGRRKGSVKRDQLLPVLLDLAQQGRTQQEIAKALGVTQGTVSNWLRSAKVGEEN